MAYTYVSALARKRSIDALWTTVDLSNEDLNVMYASYEKVYLTLSNPLYSNPVYLDMDMVRTNIPLKIPGVTVTQWLASLGSTSLPTFNNAPAFETNTVLYRDAWQAGYNIEPTDMQASLNARLPQGALNDLILTNETLDYPTFYKYGLVSVNGYLHSTRLSAYGIYVPDGMSTARKLKDNQLGILSFEDVGAIEQVPISPSMIYNRANVEPYSNFVYVNLGRSLRQKSLLFVLGGHLHCMDEAYSIIGDGLVRINMDRIPWPKIFFDTMAAIDFDSITWDSTPNNPSQISLSDLYSNKVIGAFLALTQTFFVVVDSPELYLVRHYAGKTKLPGRYTCASGHQKYPLIGPMGTIVDYTPVWENTLYVLRGRTVYDKEYLFETTPWRKAYSIAPPLYSGESIDYASAFLLELGYQQLGSNGSIPT